MSRRAPQVSSVLLNLRSNNSSSCSAETSVLSVKTGMNITPPAVTSFPSVAPHVAHISNGWQRSKVAGQLAADGETGLIFISLAPGERREDLKQLTFSPGCDVWTT